MAYKKQLKTIVITTGKSEFTVTDTVDCPAASNALAEFEAFGIMHITVGTGDAAADYLVPYHAVDNIKVTSEESEEITRPDPICGE